MTQEQLAKTRQKRLARRIEKRFPMFAEQMIDEEIRKNIYYHGVTDAEIEERRDAVLASEAELYQRCIQNVDVVFVYATER